MPNLSQIATQQERQLLRTFTRTIQGVKDQAIIQEIVRLLEVGNVDGVIDLLQLEPATFEPIEEAIRQSYRQGGLTGAEQIGPIPTSVGTLVMRFNMRNPRAEDWLRNLSSRLVTEIFDDQRTMVREVLTDNLARGVNPRQSALDLVGRIDPQTRKRVGGYIGLAENQASWVSNARNELENLDPNYLTRDLRDKRLDGAFRRAIESGKPFTSRQVDTAISRMQARTLRYRGQTIAQTESLSALSAGHDEAVRQALEVGEVEEEFTRKYWDHTGAGKEPRESHRAVEINYPNGLPPDEPFIVGGEPMQRPRAVGASAENVIWCHCRLVWKLKFAEQAAKTIRGFS